MNNIKNDEVQRMKDLMTYGLNEQEVNTGGAKPILEYSQKAADGKVYGIVKECLKYYIKVAPNKDTKLMAEDYDYIGGQSNKKEYEYNSYALASKQFDLKMMSINEANSKKVEIEQFKPVEQSEWQINETKEMRAELDRFRQITNNVAVILKEEKGMLPDEHTLPEAPDSNPSKDEVNTPFNLKAKANGDKDFTNRQKDPTKAGLPFVKDGETSDEDMQSDEKPSTKNCDTYETYGIKSKYTPSNSVVDKKPSNSKPFKFDESQKRCVKLTEEQLLAWNNSKSSEDTNEEVAHNTDDQNIPFVGNGKIGDTSPFDKKVNEDSVDVKDVAGMPDEDENDVPFPEVEDNGDDFVDDLDDEDEYEINFDDDDEVNDNFYESKSRKLQEGGHICDYDEDGNLTYTNSKETYRGVPKSIYIWHGEWSDPEIFYQGKLLNANDIEDALWDQYQEECKEDGVEPNDDSYEKWADERAQDYLDDVIFGMTESKNHKKISENDLHDFGKHPSYRKSPLKIDSTKDVNLNGTRDWNDDSVNGNKPYGNGIGSSAPYDILVDKITRSIMKQINFPKKA